MERDNKSRVPAYAERIAFATLVKREVATAVGNTTYFKHDGTCFGELLTCNLGAPPPERKADPQPPFAKLLVSPHPHFKQGRWETQEALWSP